MNTDAMNASACFTATFMKYRDPVKSTEYRTYSADLNFARSQESSPSELGHASSDLQLIVGRLHEAEVSSQGH